MSREAPEFGFSDSDEFLRGALQSLFLSGGWDALRESIGNSLKSFKPEECRKGLPAPLAQQLVLDIVGGEIRALWGLEEVYDVALLREPYLPAKRRAELSESISRQLQNRVIALLQEIRYSKEFGENNSLADQYGREITQTLGTLVAYKRRSVDEQIAVAADLNRISPGVKPPVERFNDIIGKTLVQTMRKQDFTVRLLSNTRSAPAELDSSGSLMKGNSGDGAGLKSSSSSSATSLETLLNSNSTDSEVAEILDGFSAQAVEDLSIKLRGTLLSQPLRCCLWEFTFLTRGFVEAQLGGSHMRELARLAQIKGYKIGDSASSPIADLVSRTVSNGIQNAMRLMANSDKDKALVSTLAKRSEILVHAAYILTNDFSERTVMVAILLMRVLPNDPPVSEKVLKIYLRISSECLPSEHLHKEYSTASVAHDTWQLLMQRDAALYEFLQNTARVSPAVIDTEAAQAETEVETEASSTGSKTDIPQSLLCLKGWLEAGFLGWVPEHTALFLWDQLVLEGARPETFRELLPVLCFCLLELMRESLLATNPKEVPIVESIQRAGRSLKSTRCIEVLKKVFPQEA